MTATIKLVHTRKNFKIREARTYFTSYTCSVSQISSFGVIVQDPIFQKVELWSFIKLGLSLHFLLKTT